MQILVLNAGSSSLKIDLLDPRTGDRKAKLSAERLCTDGAQYSLDGQVVEMPGADHAAVLEAALPKLAVHEIDAVGHRVVHGGPDFTRPVRIDATIVEQIAALSDLAPLHIPANLAGIRGALRLLPDIPHIAVFDTAFHNTLPRRAQAYAIPQELGYRRYGFHGPSHHYVAMRAAEFMDFPLRELRLITCHLGNGASVAAIEYGRSVETSMGHTPLEGLVMGTRSGDLDPGVILDLLRQGKSVEEVDHLLNRQSGLQGLSGAGNDMRDIEERAAQGDEQARLAIQVLAHRLRKYIGAYAAVMGGVDAIVFTAGIGENSALVRHRVLQRLDFLGARLDEDRNRDAKVDRDNPVVEICQPGGRVRLLVAKTDEARAIARDTARIAQEMDKLEPAPPIPIGVSARHIHLTQEAVELLFGPGHTLTPRSPLSQPGQFACEEKLTLVGPKRNIEGVRVLGPVRPKCQVEVSRTDEFFLGIDAPIRASGDVANTPGITLKGPAGTLTLQEGLICAWRHIHMTPADAERYGVKHGDIVDVRIPSDGRDLTFGDVMIRVKDSYKLEMHIDTDEANAAQIERGATGVLVGTGSEGTLLRRQTRYDQI
ncbi:MAG: acetate/propionate family kinase [Myxococcota bacterium]|nr:acetate/propionate family kinase [Myxococcota bacterium]